MQVEVGTLIYWNGSFTEGEPKHKWIGIVSEKHPKQNDWWRVIFPTSAQWVSRSEMEILCK